VLTLDCDYGEELAKIASRPSKDDGGVAKVHAAPLRRIGAATLARAGWQTPLVDQGAQVPQPHRARPLVTAHPGSEQAGVLRFTDRQGRALGKAPLTCW